MILSSTSDAKAHEGLSSATVTATLETRSTVSAPGTILLPPDEQALVTVANGRVVAATALAATLMGCRPDAYGDTPAEELFGPGMDGMRAGDVRTTEVRRRSGDTFRARLVARGMGRVEITYLPDGAEMVETAAGQREILEAIIRGEPVEDVLRRIAVFAETHAPGSMRASILRMSVAEGCLRAVAQPSLPAAFVEGIDRLVPGPQIASCGTAAATGMTVITPEIAGDPWWEPFAEFMESFGVRASWSTAVRSARAEHVLGTFGMYYGEPRFPTPRELYLADAFAHLTALALDRADSDEVRAREIAMRESENMRDAFFASITHDLRTPLQTMVAAAGVLEGVATVDPSQRKAVESLRDAAQHVLDVAEDAMALARPGPVELDLGRVDIATVVRRARGVVGEATDRRNITVRIVQPPVLPELHGDGRRLSRVVVNLLGNAVAHTPIGSTIVVQLEHDEFGRAVVLEVADEGPGLSASMRDVIFEPFVQGGGVREKKGGAGLGLAIVKRFVEAHGGTVAVTSSEGEGARFTVRLPVRDGAQLLPTMPGARDGATRGAAALAGRTVLLAEDDAELRAILRTGMERAGVKVLEAADGLEALEILRGDEPVDLLLLDGWMPRLDGAGVLAGLAGFERKPVVVVLSGGPGATVSGVTWEQLGAAMTLTKPVRLGDLTARVAPLLAGQP